MSAFDQKVADRPSTDSFVQQLPPNLKADCSRCAGLCCVAHAFYEVQGFAYDKPAHTPCRHLTVDNRCAIHAGRAARGFPACVAFDCYGAGQRATQELCHGMDWRTSAETAGKVFAAFTSCLALHRLIATLVLAEATSSPPFGAQLRRMRMQLDDLCRSEEAKAGTLDIARLQKDALSLARRAVLPGTSA